MKSTGAEPLPTGTATFLFTDIEGSTRLLQDLGERFETLLAQHHRIMREAVDANDGYVVGTEGDAFFVVFPSAVRAVAGAAAAQQGLLAATWPESRSVRVRMGLHTGEATLGGDNYVGIDVHRAARISAVGHGGQVLLSEATQVLVRDALPSRVGLRDLGQHRLKDLSHPEHIYQLEIPGGPTEFPRLRTLDAVPNNLPVQLTSFVGRERELAEGLRLLGASRLVTLTGPGGTGKTRLSLQLAAESADAFLDGTYFVPLATVTERDMVPAAIGQALGLLDTTGQPPLERVQVYLREKQVLLVLDNFEQVVDAAPIVADLLRSAAGIKVLVSSRAALRVYGEQEFPIPPLGLPDLAHLPDLEGLSQYEAVQLFIERAAAAKPDFHVTNENAPAVAGICARVDGLPLAIELAAARIRLLPPQTMLARLDHTLPLLASGSRDLPERQQTLRGAIAWSFDLLAESTQRLMARFGVFQGGASLDLVEAVCGPAQDLGTDVLDGLSVLVEQSLMRQTEDDGEPRFWMLATIREFALEALEKSGEADALAERHAFVFIELAERAGLELMGAAQKTGLDTLEREHDNLRAALAWLVEHNDGVRAARLAFACWRFWQMRGYIYEGRARTDDVIRVLDAEDIQSRCLAHEAAGSLAYWGGDFPATGAHYEQALEAARALGDRAGLAKALYNLSFVYSASASSDPAAAAAARGCQQEALDIYQELGDARGIAQCHWGLGVLEFWCRNLELAATHFAECAPLFRELGDRFGLGWALRMAGRNLIAMGDPAAARVNLEEAIHIFAEGRDVSGVVLVLDDFAQIEEEVGDRQRALRLSAAAVNLEQRAGVKLATAANRLSGTDRPIDGLGAEERAAVLAETQNITLDEAVDYALNQSS